MNWSQFRVTTPRGSAIFSEEFPASWAEVQEKAGGKGLWEFTADRAIGVLQVFANHWDYLLVAPGARATRRLVVALDVADTDRVVAVEFLAIELAEGLIVVAHARIRGVINPRR